MKRGRVLLRWFIGGFVGLSALWGAQLFAEVNPASISTPLAAVQLAGSQLLDQEKRPLWDPLGPGLREKDRTGWAFYVDNDFLSFSNRDHDYTGGFGLVLSGERAREYWFSVDGLRQTVDDWVGWSRFADGEERIHLHSFEAGLMAFTPKDTSQAVRTPGDRPYSSLLFISNLRQSVSLAKDTSYLSSFTLGVLGAPLAGEVQNELHDLLGGNQAQGWDQQISDGGELTARYALSRQKTHARHYSATGADYEIQSSIGGGVGYISDLHIGINGRLGRINSPWWSFNPQLTEYRSQANPVVNFDAQESTGRDEFYVWGGANLSLVMYNAFLQGQFRNSEVTFDASELNRLVLDAWLGVTKQFEAGLRVSLVLRARTKEIKTGPAARSPVWGGLIFGYAY